MNTFLWNMRYPDASSFPGMILWAASVDRSARAAGHVQSRMTVGGKPVATETFKVLADPRIKATLAEWQEQSRLALQIRDRFSEANDAVKEIRRIKAELADRAAKMPAAQQARVRRAVDRRSRRRSARSRTRSIRRRTAAARIR